jgi:alpha-mannosidase
VIERSWREKSDRVFTADKVVTSSLNRQLKELAAEVKWKGTRVFVYNALPWQRDGLVTLYTKNAGNAVKDIQTGEIIPISNEKNKIQFLAKNIPASGYRNYEFVKDAPLTAPTVKLDEQSNTIENKFYKIQFDPSKGAIASIIEKRTGKELVNKTSEYGFGQYLYERFSKKDAEDYTECLCKSIWKRMGERRTGKAKSYRRPTHYRKGWCSKNGIHKIGPGCKRHDVVRTNQKCSA